eukprot:448103-Amphidinium_carterae.3
MAKTAKNTSMKFPKGVTKTSHKSKRRFALKSVTTTRRRRRRRTTRSRDVSVDLLAMNAKKVERECFRIP